LIEASEKPPKASSSSFVGELGTFASFTIIEGEGKEMSAHISLPCGVKCKDVNTCMVGGLLKLLTSHCAL
jgi:hypothetical protein